MNLTKEQLDIIQSDENIKINAVAGSGKTTTVIEYAKSRPRDCNILYIAFNKSVRIEATKMFAEKGVEHVRVETAHSLAYKNIVRTFNYKVKSNGYTTSEIVDVLQLQGDHEKHTEYIIANHVNKFATYFCNSKCAKVQELDYLETISEPKAKVFVETFYDYIELSTREFLKKMNDGVIEITHDFYLKKFQLSNPILRFDYILFDEGQDASPAMLDIFLKQSGTKIIVGDTHQQIYGWRYAVNSLEQVDFKTFYLSASFRFGNDIATLALSTLALKRNLGRFDPVPIVGLGKYNDLKSQAVIARTNLGLLLKAIAYMRENKADKKIYFEGNINSYTYAEEGASLYDVLNLYNYKHEMIKDAFIKKMKNIVELEMYIEKTEDKQLGMMVEIVKEYGNEIYDILRDLRNAQVENDDKEKADMVFSTVHRCKGMEYDIIYLADDFMTEEQLKKVSKEKELDPLQVARLLEEVNLLYVAITRAKNLLYLPGSLMPKEMEMSKHIHEIKVVKATEVIVLPNYNRQYHSNSENTSTKSGRKNGVVEKKVKERQASSYQPWTPELDMELVAMYSEGRTAKELSDYFERTVGALQSRIKKLGLMDE